MIAFGLKTIITDLITILKEKMLSGVIIFYLFSC